MLSISQLVLSKVANLNLGSVATDISPKLLFMSQTGIMIRGPVRLNFGYAREPSEPFSRPSETGYPSPSNGAAIHHGAIDIVYT